MRVVRAPVPPAGPTSPRAIAYLHGKSLRERAKALITIAHPDDRAALEKHAMEVLHLRK